MQDSLTVIVSIFRRVGLDTNLENKRSSLCTTSYIWGGGWSKEVYKRQATGERETFR